LTTENKLWIVVKTVHLNKSSGVNIYKMYQFLCFLFFVIIFFTISCGQNKTSNELQPPQNEIKGPYFWKVEKDGKTSYFLGTFHRGIALEELQCSQTIKTHLEDSDLLFTEVANSQEQQNLNEVHEEQLRSIFFSEDTYDYQSLSNDSKIFLSSRGVAKDYSYLGYIYIINVLCMEQAIGGGSSSIDLEVKTIAEVKNIPIKYLDEDMNIEAVNESLLDIYTFTDEEVKVSDTLVNKTVLNFDNCISSHTNALNQYKAGNIPFNSFSDEVDTVLLRDRNIKWFEKFRATHTQYEQIFLASGVAHFIGNFNLLDMLRGRGFSISRMNTSCEYEKI